MIIGGWAWSADASFGFQQDEDTNQEASGCRSHLWRNELVSRRNLVTEARFLFFGWHGYKGARRRSTTSVSHWLGCLKGGRVALHQRTSIPSLKGRSSRKFPEMALSILGWISLASAIGELIRSLLSFTCLKRASSGKPNCNWCSTAENWIRRRSRNHSRPGEKFTLFQMKLIAFISGILRRCF